MAARKHVLEVDGYFYTSDERLFEGVMFQVHITEGDDGWLTIDKVDNLPQDADYLARFKMTKPREEVRQRVESDLAHLVELARSQDKTMTDLLDEWEAECPNEARIQLLSEV